MFSVEDGKPVCFGWVPVINSQKHLELFDTYETALSCAMNMVEGIGGEYQLDAAYVEVDVLSEYVDLETGQEH